jgi:class 3 adenylate cyclase
MPPKQGPGSTSTAIKNCTSDSSLLHLQQICVSGTVRDYIGDRLPYAFEDIGEKSIKNIAQPVPVYAIGGRASPR